MTSKTFKSVTDNESELDVRANDCGVFIAFSRAGQIWQASTFALSDAPALALAILEAAGYDRLQMNLNLRDAMDSLEASIEEESKRTAEAKEQAELEAEALGFFNEYRTASQLEPIDSWNEAHPLAQEQWLAVARKAREMRAEK